MFGFGIFNNDFTVLLLYIVANEEAKNKSFSAILQKIIFGIDKSLLCALSLAENPPFGLVLQKYAPPDDV